jgi:hypothetical protein
METCKSCRTHQRYEHSHYYVMLIVTNVIVKNTGLGHIQKLTKKRPISALSEEREIIVS